MKGPPPPQGSSHLPLLLLHIGYVLLQVGLHQRVWRQPIDIAQSRKEHCPKSGDRERPCASDNHRPHRAPPLRRHAALKLAKLV